MKFVVIATSKIAPQPSQLVSASRVDKYSMCEHEVHHCFELRALLTMPEIEDFISEFLRHTDYQQLAWSAPRYHRTLIVKAPWKREYKVIAEEEAEAEASVNGEGTRV